MTERRQAATDPTVMLKATDTYRNEKRQVGLLHEKFLQRKFVGKKHVPPGSLPPGADDNTQWIIEWIDAPEHDAT